MATVQDIVTAAYRKLNIVGEDVDMSPAMLANGVDAFNRMLHGWKLRGVDVEHVDLAASDAFPLDPEFQEGTVYVLAGRISPDYQVPANFDADDWFRTIQAAYAVIEEAAMPAELTLMPSQFRRYRGFL
jgi:hypothetical protein